MAVCSQSQDDRSDAATLIVADRCEISHRPQNLIDYYVCLTNSKKVLLGPSPVVFFLKYFDVYRTDIGMYLIMESHRFLVDETQ